LAKEGRALRSFTEEEAKEEEIIPVHRFRIDYFSH
jgi:hypothetical protein